VISVKDKIKDFLSEEGEDERVIFLDNGNNFEKQLVDDGYTTEIKNAIKVIEVPKCYNNKKHIEAKQKEVDDYNKDVLLKEMDKSKTEYSSAIAEEIIKSSKELPPKVVELFEIIKKILKRNEG